MVSKMKISYNSIPAFRSRQEKCFVRTRKEKNRRKTRKQSKRKEEGK